MDTAQERDLLAYAEQQIAEFQQRVADQEAVVDQLIADGHDPRAAQRLLRAFKDTLRMAEKRRQKILEGSLA